MEACPIAGIGIVWTAVSPAVSEHNRKDSEPAGKLKLLVMKKEILVNRDKSIGVPPPICWVAILPVVKPANTAKLLEKLPFLRFVEALVVTLALDDVHAVSQALTTLVAAAGSVTS